MIEYGRYRIQKELGKGNMGVVYLALDPQIERPVALKVLREDRMVSEDFVLRFVKEAKAIGRLSHPNIVTVYDVGQDHNTIYIAMEYLEGKPFDEVISGSRLEMEQIIDIGVQVAETLEYAHKKKIIHRDIKPSNIILTNEGRVKLTDFGIARIEDPSVLQQTQAGEILGTPVYMSPEQAMGSPIDGRADLYSLGVILYELIAGRRPFNGSNITAILGAILQDTPEPPAQIDPFIPQSLSDLVMKSLSRNPDDRFQTGADMALALNAERGGGAQGTSEERKPEKKAKPKIIWMAAIFMVLVVAMGGWYLWETKMKTVLPKSLTKITDTKAEKETSEDKDPIPDKVALEKSEKITEIKPQSTDDNTPLVEQTTPRRETAISTREASETEEIASNGEESKKQIETNALQPQATLMVESSPAGTQVFIDGLPKGITPLNIKLPLGEYEVRMSLAGHYEWKASLELSEEGDVPLHVNLFPTD